MKRRINLVVFFICVGLLATMTPASAQMASSSRLTQAQIQDKLQHLEEIQARNEDRVLQIPGVVGIGIGLNRDRSDLCFIVYAEKITDQIKGRLSAGIENVPVRLIESGELRAY
jgi:hypothetical protein